MTWTRIFEIVAKLISLSTFDQVIASRSKYPPAMSHQNMGIWIQRTVKDTSLRGITNTNATNTRRVVNGLILPFLQRVTKSSYSQFSLYNIKLHLRLSNITSTGSRFGPLKCLTTSEPTIVWKCSAEGTTLFLSKNLRGKFLYLITAHN